MVLILSLNSHFHIYIILSMINYFNQRRGSRHSNINVKFCTSRLCMKMSSFLFVRAWEMPRIFHLSCGIPFPVRTPDNISISYGVAV